MNKLSLILSSLMLSVSASGAWANDQQLSREVRLPIKASVAIYLPAQMRTYRGFPGIFESGQTLEDTVLAAGQLFFTDTHIAEGGTDTPYGLLLALHPEVTVESGHAIITLNYAVFGADDDPLLKGTESVTLGDPSIEGHSPSNLDPLQRMLYRTTQLAMIALINGLHPEDGKYPGNLTLKSRSLLFAVRKDKPWSSGTGFYFNSSGQILTAAHVVENCLGVDVKREEKALPAKVVARSNVVDLAALDTGVASTGYLPFRRDLSIELGEDITSVGYPLANILSASPTLTRGNISALGGLAGSAGQLQFSAPIQPGSSGGPIVSDGGAVLGITVGTLSVQALARQGVIPQNVNFALESRYAVKFLQKNALTFASVDTSTHGDTRAVGQAALAAIVRVQCYE